VYKDHMREEGVPGALVALLAAYQTQASGAPELRPIAAQVCRYVWVGGCGWVCAGGGGMLGEDPRKGVGGEREGGCGQQHSGPRLQVCV
jgi:hypothetical protein